MPPLSLMRVGLPSCLREQFCRESVMGMCAQRTASAASYCFLGPKRGEAMKGSLCLWDVVGGAEQVSFPRL